MNPTPTRTVGHLANNLDAAHAESLRALVAVCNATSNGDLAPESLNALAAALRATFTVRDHCAFTFTAAIAALDAGIVRALIDSHPTLFDSEA